MAAYPFLSDAFLDALATSGAITRTSGATAAIDTGIGTGTGDDSDWQDLSWREGEGFLPLYRRQGSRGEYVFDHRWAMAYAQHGQAYYPRLVTAIPYTPVTGPRWRLPEGKSAADWLWPRLPELVEEQGASSWHVLFPDEAAREALSDLPLATRAACHFRWFNRGYAEFDDFLGTLMSRKRKTLRKERERVDGLVLRRATGADIPAHWWPAFYACYARTYHIRGQHPYLTPAFFDLLAARLGDQIMLAVALDTTDPMGTPLAAALYLFDDTCLYGRYWGALRDLDALHFELCYYQGIEFAIERGLAAFDPGVQGEHKLLRGFEPVLTWSMHWHADPRFHDAIQRFCAAEEEAVRAYQAEARAYLPYRRGESA